MRNNVTADDLAPWRDPLEILSSLVEVPNDELPSLRDSIHRLLWHEDVDIRAHAASRLFVHLKDREHHVDSLALLRNDPEPKVRRVAAFAVSSTSSPATREEDQRALLEALLNELEDVRVRGAAYEALLLMHDRRDLPPVNRDTDLKRDVNWAWIQSLRQGTGPPG